MLKIHIQVFPGKMGEKLRLGASVDLANQIYQFSFTHKLCSFKSPHHPKIIGRGFFVALTSLQTAQVTTYNLSHYITSSARL
jgi:hypothetical protein